MIERDEIDDMSATLGVNSSDVQRDYVFGWLLAALYGEQLLPEGYVLKGGSCLRKGYFEKTRYTRDLDFSFPGRVDPHDLEVALKRACRVASARSGLRFDVERTFVRRKERISEDLAVFEGRVYFSNFYGKPGSVIIRADVDATAFDRLYLPPVARPLIHPYSDALDCSAEITCAQLEEVLAGKLKCLLQRRHVADLYDLCHWIFFHGDAIDRRAMLGVFLRKTIYRPDPGAAGELLKNLAFDKLSGLWSKYVSCPADVLMPFTEAVEEFLAMVGALFGRPRGWGAEVFFPSALRNPLLEAGSTTRLVKIVYDGVARIAEPYALRFKHNQAGQAREYLYVHERLRGGEATGHTKTFLAGKTRSVEVLEEKFEPRHPIELSSAGEYGPKRDFDRGARLPRALGSRRRTTKRGGKSRHKVRCPLCNKTFTRKRAFDTKLNRHKNQRGQQCSGRTGFPVT